MTDHVRTGYRNHRKAAWGLALLLVAAIATVTIPFASGAATKTLVRLATPQPRGEAARRRRRRPSRSPSSRESECRTRSPPPTPSLTASGAGTIATSPTSALSHDVRQHDLVLDLEWWRRTRDAPSGVYTFGATLGTLTATSNPSAWCSTAVPRGGVRLSTFVRRHLEPRRHRPSPGEAQDRQHAQQFGRARLPGRP